jgi:hypothetical protein
MLPRLIARATQCYGQDSCSGARPDVVTRSMTLDTPNAVLAPVLAASQNALIDSLIVLRYEFSVKKHISLCPPLSSSYYQHVHKYVCPPCNRKSCPALPTQSPGHVGAMSP